MCVYSETSDQGSVQRHSKSAPTKAVLCIYISSAGHELGLWRVDRILVDESNTGTTRVQIKLLVIRGKVFEL